jgi:hypothetical protein
MTFVKVSYESLDRQRRRQEQERLRKARNRHRWIDVRTCHHDQRRFVGWDGEGPRDAGYALFGNSDGDEICHPFLQPHECLDLIIRHKQNNRDTINVWFGQDYDVSMILDLPRRNMVALQEYGKTIWFDYRLEHIPHKWFRVSRGEISVVIYDIHSFFDSGYADALQQWKVGTEAERAAIVAGKQRRAEFLWADIESIREYFRLELKLMPELTDRLREVFADAGYVPRSWHGPGALAGMALRRHGVYDAMAETPSKVSNAARHAFIGGRFEDSLGGWFQTEVWNYDIHSAYPYFATFLPNLARGTWRRTRKFEPGKFAVYHIRYESQPDSFRMYPLPKRLPNGGVAWPYRVTGWYWAPEAELVANDQDAKILKGWVFDEFDETDRPFAWLQEYYLRRQRLKNNGSAAEYTFKLIINAVYGLLARRVGWDKKNKKSPKTHQIEWAGYITSACRAAVHSAGILAGDKLISIDTDGIYTLTPISGLDIGDNLGQWECERYDDGVFWQSGIYCLKKGGEWKKAKTRGIPKGTYTPDELLEHVSTGEPLKLVKNKFIGYRQANNGQWEKRNTWVEDRPQIVFGGAGKRSHLGRNGNCNDHCYGNVHAFGAAQITYGPDGTPDSEPHYLPWLDNELEILTAKEYGYYALSEDDPDSEEIGWMKAIRTPTPLRMTFNSNVSVVEHGIEAPQTHASQP